MMLKNQGIYLFLLLVFMGEMKNAAGQARFNTYIDRPIDANYSGHISDVEITFDGGYVTVSGDASLNISKFSQTGSLLWSTDVAWGGGIYYARNVVQLKDSGFAVTGTGGPGYDPSSDWEVAFMRLDKNGKLLWVESFNGSSNSFNMGSHILQTLDGGLLVVGQYNSNGILIKTDINGNQQWANTYSPLTRFRTAFQNADSSYTVWGVNDNNNGFALGKVAIDKNGNVISGKGYALNFFTQYLAVKQTSDGGFIAQFDDYGTQPVLMKTDSTDKVLWTKVYTFDNNPNNTRDPRDVEPVDGGYIFTGEDFTNPEYNNGFSTAFWAKTDYSGNILWIRDYQTQYWDVAYSVKETADKGLVLWTSMFTTGSQIVADLIKTDSLGNTVCTLYKDTATSSPLTLTPAAITVTSTTITGITVQTNSYSSGAATTGNPCSSSPEAQFAVNQQTICSGSTVNFTDQSSGSPTSWAWTFNGGTPGSSTAQNPSVTYNTPGFYPVKLVVTNTLGTDSLTIASYITVSPAPIAGGIIGPDTICAGSSVQLSDTGSAGSLQWQSSSDDILFTNIIGDTLTTYHADNVGQTTYYRVQVSNSCAADTSPAFKLLVNPLLTPVAFANDSLICSDDSAQIQIKGSYSAYLWNNADTMPYTYVSAAGGYWVTVTDVNGCSAESNHVNIRVYPVPSVSLVVQGDTLSSYNSSSYQWYKDGVLIPGATSAVYIVKDSGNYTLQITDTNGCKAISNPVFVAVTGIYETGASNGISIYPNPFSNFIFIEKRNAGMEIKDIEMDDVTGRVVLNEQATGISSVSTVDVSQLPSGMYFIRVTSTETTYTFKMVKN